MEAPKSEGPDDRGRNDLIRDISRVARNTADPFTLEHHLMRLADDPLLVRDFMQRIHPAGPVARTAPPMPVKVTLALAGTAAPWTGLGSAAGPAKEQRFEAASSCESGSVFPFAFRPTVEDRKVALNHSESAGPRQARVRYGVAFAAVVFSFVIFMILIPMLRN